MNPNISNLEKEIYSEELLNFIKHCNFTESTTLIETIINIWKPFILKNIPELVNKKVHIIGLQHGADSKFFTEKDQDIINQTIASQEKTLLLLQKINPDIVGVEGFCGENFTPRNLVIQEFNAIGVTKPSISMILAGVAKTSNDKSINCVSNFWKIAKEKCTFIGIEEFLLINICDKVMNLMNRQTQYNYSIDRIEETNKFLEELFNLRGYLMLAHLNYHMNTKGKDRAAIPVGKQHVEIEFRKVIDIFNPKNWVIYDAVPEINKS